jgi:hypothetical protein
VLIYSGIPQGDIPPDREPVTWIEKPVERDKLTMCWSISLRAQGRLKPRSRLL